MGKKKEPITFLGYLEKKKEYDLLSAIKIIIKKASEILRNVQTNFFEYTLHDEKHSKNVLLLMEQLIGKDANNLSSYELFSLIAAAYLHDCGMSISDYEIRVLLEVEKLDEAKSLNHNEAKKIIISKKETIYPGGFEGDIQNWWFVPNDEKSLIEYLISIMEEYQELRNREVCKIRKARNSDKPIENLEKENKSLRTDYLRNTHHIRIENYIKNLKENSYFIEQIRDWASLAVCIAKICRAHGEEKEYIEKELDLFLIDDERKLNSQFVAMMLRLADIADFSADRAPIILRALRIFESERSFEEWKKQENIHPTILTKKKQINYIAEFKNPQYYYSFQIYVDSIDKELELYAQLKPKWETNDYNILQKSISYPKISEKVQRQSIKYDDRTFIPTDPILNFKLDQESIIGLLMGKKLYKNKYACLRELYQNSLDACRCKIAKDRANGASSTGNITFGLKLDSNGRKYVYCLDNGIGMTQSIIKNYLLNIGNSYYKSPEFYRDQAITGNKFNPVSQFGIGILSCFMIGDEIEIITKNEQDDCITCVIPRKGFFYYKPTESGNSEKVSSPSGTLVKIFLNKDVSLNNQIFDDLSFYIIRNRPVLQPYLENEDPLWVNNLYHILNDFVISTHEDINVEVELLGNSKLQIFDKPLVIGKDKFFKIPKDEYETFAEAMKFVTGYKKPVILEIDNTKSIILNKEVNGIQYKFSLSFLKNDFKFQKGMDLSTIVLPIHRRNGFCIDGIKINVEPSLAQSFFRNMGEYGIVNFYGENQPTISVDRDTIIEDDLSKYDFIAKKVLEGIIDDGIAEIIYFIDDNNISENSLPYYYAWRSFIFRFIFCIDILLDRILRNESACQKLVTIKENEDKKKNDEKYEIDNNIGKIYPSILNWIKIFYDAKSEGKTLQRFIPLNGLDLGYYKTKNPSFYKALMYGLVFNKKDQDDFSISIVDPITKKPQ